MLNFPVHPSLGQREKTDTLGQCMAPLAVLKGNDSISMMRKFPFWAMKPTKYKSKKRQNLAVGMRFVDSKKRQNLAVGTRFVDSKKRQNPAVGMCFVDPPNILLPPTLTFLTTSWTCRLDCQTELCVSGPVWLQPMHGWLNLTYRAGWTG